MRRRRHPEEKPEGEGMTRAVNTTKFQGKKDSTSESTYLKKNTADYASTDSPIKIFRAAWRLGKRLYDRANEGCTEAEVKTVRTTFIFYAVSILALMIVKTGYSLYWSFVIRRFTTSLQEKDSETFYKVLVEVMVLLLLNVPLSVGKDYCRGFLTLFLRRRFTKALFGAFLNSSSNAYYHTTLENAGMRILEVEDYVGNVQRVVLKLLRRRADLVAFSSLMVYLSFRLFGALAMYSLFGTWLLVHFFYEKVTRSTAETTKKRTGVQYALVRIRENKESIAFLDGGGVEFDNMLKMFESYIDTVGQNLKWNIWLETVKETLDDLTVCVPYIVVAPLYFAGTVEYGVVSQSSMAFFRIKSALNVLSDHFQTISTITASNRRLEELLNDLQAFGTPKINLTGDVIHDDSMIRVEGLTSSAPAYVENGVEQVEQQVLFRNLTFEVKEGDSLIIMGPSGAGKTSLLRILGGLWPYDSGTITKPARVGFQGMFFLPQRPYITLGTLRQQLIYPDTGTKQRMGDGALTELLRKVGLHHLTCFEGGLDAHQPWADMLSVGEQQRIGFCRMFYHEPKFVLMDESTSALDLELESRCMELCTTLKITLISVGHRPSLKQFHKQVLTLTGDDGRFELAPSV